MNKDLENINDFLQEHHVLSLATYGNFELSSCCLFYKFIKEELCFVVASSEDTLHIQNIQKNPNVSGTIVLETKTIGKIQGVQFKGIFSKLEDEKLKKEYFKAFQYALVMKPVLWKVEVSYFKMTDNALGFGKKIIWDSFV